MIANKVDADRPDDPLATRNLAQLRERTSLPIVAVSARCGDGITDLTQALRALVERVKAVPSPPRV